MGDYHYLTNVEPEPCNSAKQSRNCKVRTILQVEFDTRRRDSKGIKYQRMASFVNCGLLVVRTRLRFRHINIAAKEIAKRAVYRRTPLLRVRWRSDLP